MEPLQPIPGEIPIDLPKPELEEPKNKPNAWFRSLTSLGFFLVIGYFFFHQNWKMILVLTLVVIIHEMGHFLAMKIYKYQELGIFFIPLMGAYVSGKKQEVSQKQSAIILLAGPIPGIIIGIVLYFLAFNFESSDLESAASIFIVLNALNLLPVYPLDGGQLLHRLVLDKYNILGKVFVIISTAVLTALGIAFLMIDIRFAFLLFFPIMMIMRMISDIQHERIEKKIEAEGVDLMKSYEELSAEEYWRIRNLLIKYYPQLRDVKPSPPYEISPKEEQVITTIQGLLQRSLIEDLSVTGKFLILVIWISFFIVPILLMDPFANF